MKVYNYLLIYFRMISESKNEEAFIRNVLDSKIGAMQNLKEVNIKNLPSILYSQNTCVIESDIQHHNIGVISNITESC